jgi:hypothetical protein
MQVQAMRLQCTTRSAHHVPGRRPLRMVCFLVIGAARPEGVPG